MNGDSSKGADDESNSFDEYMEGGEGEGELIDSE